MTEETKHLCKSRETTPRYPGTPEYDTWRVHYNGERTCSFCGSLHEDDFMKILEEYIKGTAGYSFDTTDKNYKYYANFPGVKHAGGKDEGSNPAAGGIKFYGWHVTPGQKPEDVYPQRFAEAYKKYTEEFRKKYG